MYHFLPSIIEFEITILTNSITQSVSLKFMRDVLVYMEQNSLTKSKDSGILVFAYLKLFVGY